MFRLLALVFGLCAAQAAFADPVSSVRFFESDGVVRVDVEGGATADTPFALASIGKTMTSVAVLRLVAENRLSLDDMASEYVERDISDGLGGLDGVSLRHLLTMTSGLPDYLTDAYVWDALDDPDNVQNPTTALSYVYGEPQRFRPGRDFDYSNTNYVLLGLVLEEVTGLPYASAMQELVFEPAGMGRSFVFGSRALPEDFPNGHEGQRHIRGYYAADGFGDGGVISTAGDVATFYKALFVERSLLPPASLDALLTDMAGAGYGMGIDIEGQIVGHAGGDLGFSSDVRMNTDTGAVAVMLAARADADTDWTWDIVAGP